MFLFLLVFVYLMLFFLLDLRFGSFSVCCANLVPFLLTCFKTDLRILLCCVLLGFLLCVLFACFFVVVVPFVGLGCRRVFVFVLQRVDVRLRVFRVFFSCFLLLEFWCLVLLWRLSVPDNSIRSRTAIQNV